MICRESWAGPPGLARAMAKDHLISSRPGGMNEHVTLPPSVARPPSLPHRLLVLLLAWSALAGALASSSSAADPVVLENASFRYVIGPDARNRSFTDLATGRDYLRPTPPSACATIRRAGRVEPATAAKLTEGRLQLGFGNDGPVAVLRTESRPYAVLLAVESITGADVEGLTFLDVPLTLNAVPTEPFGACALALNLGTRIDALPALQSDLRASCESRFGLVGARAALVAGPLAGHLKALQETLSDASELPVCRVAGPWAQDVPFNHGSYLFNFGTLTETNVDDWIAMTRTLGFTQIDNHGGGGFFRFGDLELNAKKWPEGWAGWRRIVDRLHGAGVGSILHTYAFFIDKRSTYVTPVPDPRLDAFRTFTLAEPLTAEATEVVVRESTAGISTVTGFFEHNSTVLQLGEELVSFEGATRAAPWRFTGVKRGSLGTRAAAHPAGAAARHLKECFGLFVPDVESTLFEEIAARHADVVNRCGFDGIYLDAIDGSSILRGNDACWYWANRFVVEIQKRLAKPVGMEMSAMWHQFWQYRTRWQAWDYPQRGHVRFVDQHAQGVNGGLMLPLHLGWWGFQSFNPPQIEPTYPDVMENVGARLVGWDAGISLTAGVDREALRTTPLFRRAVEILRACEDLRHAGTVSEATRARLRTPGQEFALTRDAAGAVGFRHVQSQRQDLSATAPWTLTWTGTNGFSAQPARFRIEALTAVPALPVTNSVLLADLGKLEAAAWKTSTANGITFGLAPSTEAGGGATLTATNSGAVARNAAWIRWERRFDPPLNLSGQPALALDLDGDASGALVAVRLESPPALAFGAVADRYVPVDFSGRRGVTLVETESSRWSDYVWNDGKGLYNLHRETIHFDRVETLTVWVQNLAPGRTTRLRVGRIQAVPAVTGRLKNPQVTFAGVTLEFPIDLASGSWIEANGPEDCLAYGPKGESLGKITPRGPWPMLPAGPYPIAFGCDPDLVLPSRARVTVFHQGESL